MKEDRLFTIIICLIVLLGGMLLSTYLEHDKDPLVIVTQEELRKKNTLKFLELFSLGDPLAFRVLEPHMGTTTYLQYSTLLHGGKRVAPRPLVYYFTVNRNDDTGVIMFDTKTNPTPTVFKYTIKYGEDGYIETLKSDYLYGGGSDE